MQKVKVSRYVSGKRPEYAPRSSSEDESDEEEFISHQKFKTQEDEGEEEEEYVSVCNNNYSTTQH